MKCSWGNGNQRYIAVSGIALAVVLVLAFIRPGPVAPPFYEDTSTRTGAPASPAVDMSGSQRVFSADDGATPGAAVFWELPEPGTVKITIELDSASEDEQGDEGPPTGDDQSAASES